MDIREVRRHNLKRLMDERFGAGARGAQSRLADMLGKPQNFISRCLADPDRPGAKTIGEDFAREIEGSFGLPRYALDHLDAPTREVIPLEHPLPTAKGELKNYGFWIFDHVFGQIKTEDRGQQIKLIKTLRDEITHRNERRIEDKHRAQKLLYAIATAAVDNKLQETEYQIIEAAVSSIAVKYELEELEAKLDGYRKMGIKV